MRRLSWAEWWAILSECRQPAETGHDSWSHSVHSTWELAKSRVFRSATRGVFWKLNEGTLYVDQLAVWSWYQIWWPAASRWQYSVCWLLQTYGLLRVFYEVFTQNSRRPLIRTIKQSPQWFDLHILQNLGIPGIEAGPRCQRFVTHDNSLQLVNIRGWNRSISLVTFILSGTVGNATLQIRHVTSVRIDCHYPQNLDFSGSRHHVLQNLTNASHSFPSCNSSSTPFSLLISFLSSAIFAVIVQVVPSAKVVHLKHLTNTQGFPSWGGRRTLVV